MKEEMILQRRWDILHKFELKQKESFLKKLTINESLKILNELYRFTQKIGDKEYCRKLNMERIQILSKVHFMFMKV